MRRIMVHGLIGGLTGAMLLGNTAVATISARRVGTSANVRFESRLTLDKTTIVLGEPIFAAYTIHNASNRKLQFMEGAENCYWASDRFQFCAVRADGLKVMPPPPPANGIFCGNFMTCARAIQPHSSYAFDRFLTAELKITRPGTYTITCRKIMQVSPAQGNASGFGPQVKYEDVPTQANVVLTVLPPDRWKLGKVIADLGRKVAAPCKTVSQWKALDHAAQELSAIADAQAVPWLLKMLYGRDSGRKMQALEALGRFNNVAAFDGIVSGLNVRADEVLDCCTTRELAEQEAASIHLEAARALTNSPYSGALPRLRMLRHRGNKTLRLMIAQAIQKREQSVQPRKLAVASYSAKDGEQALTVWDVPLPAGAKVFLPVNADFPRGGSAPPAYNQAVYLARQAGGKSEEKSADTNVPAGDVILVAYWEQRRTGQVTNLIANVFVAPNKHVYLVTGWTVGSSVTWRVYDVDVRKSTGKAPLVFDPVSCNRWPASTRQLAAMSSAGGGVSTRVRVEYDRGNLRLYGGDQEKFFEDGYWKLNLKTRKWTETVRGMEKEMPGLADQPSFPR